MISSTANQLTAAAVRGTELATATPSPSPRAAGTPRTQVRARAAREQHTATPTSRAPNTSWTSSPIDTACRPSTTISATTPMGPTSPRRITIRDRSAVQPEPNPSTVSASPSMCRARLPSASPPTINNPTAKPGSPAVRASQPSSPTATASGSTASGAMIMAPAAVRRSISPMAPDGTTVSVPTESRNASSMTASAGGDEISKQGQLAEHEDSRAQHRKGGKGTSTFT